MFKKHLINKVPRELHKILVTFYDGETDQYKTAKYTTAIMHGPYGLQYDPSVVEVVDLETYEVLYSAAI